MIGNTTAGAGYERPTCYLGNCWLLSKNLVAGPWALYAASKFPSRLISAQPMVRTFLNMTCPIAFSSFHFHIGLRLYWVLLANAATYGLFGLAGESLRRHFSQAQ